MAGTSPVAEPPSVSVAPDQGDVVSEVPCHRGTGHPAGCTSPVSAGSAACSRSDPSGNQEAPSAVVSSAVVSSAVVPTSAAAGCAAAFRAG